MNTKVTMSVSDGRGMAQAALAQQYARIIEVQEQLEKLKRQAAAEEKAMYDSSCNPASATTHAKIVLGASVMALVLAGDAKEGSLAYRIREYLAETMPRNKDRELFRLPPLSEEQIKSVRAQRQSRISAALGATRKQAEQLYADKKRDRPNRFKRSKLSQTTNSRALMSTQRIKLRFQILRHRQ